MTGACFWVLRSTGPWRDLPDNFGPYTTSTIASFAGDGRTSGRIINELAATQDAVVKMIDTSNSG
jgi:transposase